MKRVLKGRNNIKDAATPQSLSPILVHIIFSTKHKQPLITPDCRHGLSAYLAGILTKLDCLPVKISCADDHVHILSHLCKNLPLAKVIEEVKKGSSKWMKTQSPSLEGFYRQSGIFRERIR
ncbi:MAG: transposase [Planctomycetes bacterium]|nr:transposase [Planctomycetota bacterium]